MKDIFNGWEPIINTYKTEPHVEIEIRFGKINRGTFDTNVGKETFEKVLRRLRKYSGWEDVKETLTTAYYDAEKRIIMNDQTDEMESAVIKRKLVSNDKSYDGFPADVRLGISVEIPYDRDADENENFTRVKKRKRYSFIRKNLSIDLTEVSGDVDDKDSEEETTYQIELEIIDVSQIHERHKLFNIVYKINDICKIMC